MEVLSTIPRTSTFCSSCTTLDSLVLEPSRYVVADESFTVTFCPVTVVNVKPEGDTLVIVPVAPPAAGAVRAFDAPSPDPKPNAPAAGVGAASGSLDRDEATPTDAPVSPRTNADAAIQRLFLLRSHRGPLEARASVGLIPPSFITSSLLTATPFTSFTTACRFQIWAS